ncbi:MAG: FHA domain-containing protein [Myxococcota bacterium]
MALLARSERSPMPLPPRLLVGRAATATLRLDATHVSGEHATLFWTGEAWHVRDLASRNGTWVNGRRLERGDEQPLLEGDRIGFGAPDPTWRLLDASPPGAVALTDDGRARSAEHGLVVLPDDEAPVALVFPDEVGEWWLEVDDQRTRVADGHPVVIDGVTWRLHIPGATTATGHLDPVVPLSTVHLAFEVSRDQEHVQITVSGTGDPRRLEPREHAYVLLLLARQRLADAALPEPDQGWVDRDELLRWLRFDKNALNVAIYRARGQLAQAGIDGAAGIVEVRRRQRRLGLPPARLAVS